jgi:KDO2-lipid IV(A) lauroyltransferase
MWEHLFLLVLEVAHAPRKIRETNWRRYVRLREEDRLVRLLLSERPVLIVTGHFGNFELGGYVLAILGFPTYTVARTLDNPYLDRFVNMFRGATGQRMIPKVGGYDQIVEVLSGGGTMTFLADQYAGRKGCWVEFFARPASAHKAIALLAFENDAPVVVSSARRFGGLLNVELHPVAAIDPRDGGEQVANVRTLTQWYTSHIEEIIRRTPHQYWWLHRRWKDTRKKRAKRKAA